MKTYTVREISTMLKTNPETVRRWIRSGKLEAIQDSRKEGNIITEQMLKKFLSATPKYAGLLMAFSPTVGLSFTATSLIGLLLRQYRENETTKTARVSVSEVEKLLKTDIANRKKEILFKEEKIRQIQSEIDSDRSYIAEAEQLIKEMAIQKKKVTNKGELI